MRKLRHRMVKWWEVGVSFKGPPESLPLGAYDHLSFLSLEFSVFPISCNFLFFQVFLYFCFVKK
jgi:hypothetical protein